ncbi:hypothetical protein SYNPCC7002_A2588 [Picosynechococcus sp. PCC 7002]|nr:hypothetical protein SYNPCC7002_A2588 [Picosynechococcus sp. PCC 7002]
MGRRACRGGYKKVEKVYISPLYFSGFQQTQVVSF